MDISLTAWIICGIIAVFFWYNSRKRLCHLPGPIVWPLLGNIVQLRDIARAHLTLQSWSKTYGPIIRVSLLNGENVVVSSYQALHDVLLRNGGYDVASRSKFWRAKYIFKETGILTNMEADATWKNLRRLSQKHLKQFGDGLSRLESVISDIGEEMFTEFRENDGSSFNPSDCIHNVVFKSISFLITGDRTQNKDSLLSDMKLYTRIAVQHGAPTASPDVMVYDMFPWLRHLGLNGWQKIKQVVDTEDKIWNTIKKGMDDNPNILSLAKLLLAHVQNDAGGIKQRITSIDGTYSGLTETDAKRTCSNLLLAGLATTSSSFYSLINILAHRRDVQHNILLELQKNVPDGRPVKLIDRPQMHYTRAVIYELLRYVTVVALGVSHRASTDVLVQGHHIPAGTRIITNLWAFHHDPDIWDDPDTFTPERFLEDDGTLVPADHWNRKHLLPFGAGARVCLGEALALARLFLWTATLVQKFDIKPAEGNHKALINTSSYYFAGVVYPRPYSVVFSRRS